ncbi:MAG: hypothetical protein OEZ58_02740 [Gammaproteobacteria bacterium]|nr:hypothetical protein [Gammaproteobacteria bacterium]MDH5727880.1 hypothetical protein [Gammaproteobacteria bacterium]
MGYRFDLQRFKSWSIDGLFGYRMISGEYTDLDGKLFQIQSMHKLFSNEGHTIELGFGISYDTEQTYSSEVKDDSYASNIFGDMRPFRVTLKSSAGLMLSLNYYVTNFMQISAKYIKVDYKSDNGQIYNGDQLGIELNMSTGLSL